MEPTIAVQEPTIRERVWRDVQDTHDPGGRQRQRSSTAGQKGGLVALPGHGLTGSVFAGGPTDGTDGFLRLCSIVSP